MELLFFCSVAKYTQAFTLLVLSWYNNLNYVLLK